MRLAFVPQGNEQPDRLVALAAGLRGRYRQPLGLRFRARHGRMGAFITVRGREASLWQFYAKYVRDLMCHVYSLVCR